MVQSTLTRMKSMPRSSFATMVVAFISLFVVSCAAAQETCKLTASGVASVTNARDGRTLLLADGRELLLAGIEVTDGSRAALELLVGGRDVGLEQSGSKRDRYGRVIAFVYTEDTGQSVQQAMLERGQARVSARIGEKRCADLLLRVVDRAARAARRGLWADSNFAPLRSENTSQIAAARGQFALVEGKVLSVSGKRRHNIFELRAALDARLHCYCSQAPSAGIRHQRSRVFFFFVIYSFSVLLGGEFPLMALENSNSEIARPAPPESLNVLWRRFPAPTRLYPQLAQIDPARPPRSGRYFPTAKGKIGVGP